MALSRPGWTEYTLGEADLLDGLHLVWPIPGCLPNSNRINSWSMHLVSLPELDHFFSFYNLARSNYYTVKFNDFHVWSMYCSPSYFFYFGINDPVGGPSSSSFQSSGAEFCCFRFPKGHCDFCPCTDTLAVSTNRGRSTSWGADRGGRHQGDPGPKSCTVDLRASTDQSIAAMSTRVVLLPGNDR